MDKKNFIAAGEAAFGPRWQTDIAEALGVSDRTVRHWVSGKYGLPPTIGADIQSILARRIVEIQETMEMTKERYLMNPMTGSVDTDENWLAEMPSWDEDPAECQRQYNTLIEVAKNSDGDWIEVD